MKFKQMKSNCQFKFKIIFHGTSIRTALVHTYFFRNGTNAPKNNKNNYININIK